MVVGLAACGGSSSTAPPTTGATASTGSTPPTTVPSPTSTGGSTTTTGIPACQTAALAISLGAPNGSAGSTHYGLTFHNTGAGKCTLYGYPGVSFLDATAHQIGAPAQRLGGSGPATVTLVPGGDGFSTVAVTDPGIPPCSGATTATEVRVFPPGETHPSTVAAPSSLQVCSSPNTTAYRSATVAVVSSTGI
jgi:hypothetical protein